MPALLQSTEDAEYMEMEAAFHSSGGIVTADEVASLLQMRTEQPISMLARWIVSREVLSFQWRSRTLLPLFQFELSTMTLRPAVAKVIGELLTVQTEWETAMWFARPNTWLADVAPVDVVDRDPGTVIDAARADGYLIRG